MIFVNDLRGDMILSACLRHDLAPIPLTFEGQFRVTSDTAADFQDGRIIKVNEIDFRIVKAEPIRNRGGGTQGKHPLSAVSVTAFPEGCVNVAKPRQSAVVFQNASLAGVYRACGATVPLAGDFTVPRFACFVGDTPTFHLARVLQEESAVMTWRQGKLQAMRLRDLFQQTPIDSSLDEDSAEDIRSGFLESGEVPVYISTAPDGSFLSGTRRQDFQGVTFSPRKTERELNGMGKVLVRRKVITGKPNLLIRAGDLVSVRGVPMAVLTAAHYMQNNTDGGGANQYSRLWLGSAL